MTVTTSVALARPPLSVALAWSRSAPPGVALAGMVTVKVAVKLVAPAGASVVAVVVTTPVLWKKTRATP